VAMGRLRRGCLLLAPALPSPLTRPHILTPWSVPVRRPKRAPEEFPFPALNSGGITGEGRERTGLRIMKTSEG